MKEFFKRNPKQPEAGAEATKKPGQGIVENLPKFTWRPNSSAADAGKPDQKTEPAREIPNGLWIKCTKCKELIYSKEFINNKKVCTKCGHHVRLGAHERIEMLVDEGSFEEMDAGMIPADPLQFVSSTEPPYPKKAADVRKKTGLNESLVIGTAKIEGKPLAISVCDFAFLGGSMGSVFGEKMTRLVEKAIQLALPVLTISASGGARMHEGVFSLMQLAKMTAALAVLGEHRLPHFSLCTDPTLGGVSASYASIGDVIMAEPGAMIGFAGARVIEQTTHQKLPPGFQSSEFLLEHGMLDMIVPRRDLRPTLSSLMTIYELAYKQGQPSQSEVSYGR